MFIARFATLLFLIAASPSSTDLSMVSAEQIGPVETKEIARGKNFNFALSLSQDNSKLLYSLTTGCKTFGEPTCKHWLVLYDLNHKSQVGQYSIPRPAEATAISPDGSRLAYCFYNPGSNPAQVSQPTIAILERASGKITVVDTIRNCHRSEGVWEDSSHLSFLTPNAYAEDSVTIDLDLLAQHNASDELKGRYLDLKERSTHKLAYINFAFDRDIEIKNKDDSFTKSLDFFGDSQQCLVSRDLKHVVIGNPWGTATKEGYVLRAYTLGGQPAPQIMFSLEFGTALELTQDEMKVIEAGSPGEDIVGMVYDPKINPLNGKTVGYQGAKAKGYLVLLPHLKGRLISVTGEIRSGDVVTFGDRLPVRKGMHFTEYFDAWAVLH